MGPPATRPPCSVLGSLVDGNHSAGKGAGISSEGSGATLLVAHSAIVNNASDNDGGGIYLGGGWGNDIIQSSTISGNTTSGVGRRRAGAVRRMTNTYVHILNSTIANNTASGTGGGIEFEPRRRAGLVAGRVGVLEHRGGQLLPRDDVRMEHQRGLEPARTGVFNCVRLVHLRRAGVSAARPTWGGCTFDVRNPLLGPLTPLGGEGDLPAPPAAAPAARPSTPPWTTAGATSSATAGSPTSIRPPARRMDDVRAAGRRRRRRHGGARPRRLREERALADGAARRAGAGSLHAHRRRRSRRI